MYRRRASGTDLKSWKGLPLQKISLAKNRFLPAGKGGENTKEKSRQCFTCKAVAP
jgi:hypothetical protein